MGTQGYAAPEYIMTGICTTIQNVYQVSSMNWHIKSKGGRDTISFLNPKSMLPASIKTYAVQIELVPFTLLEIKLPFILSLYLVHVSKLLRNQRITSIQPKNVKVTTISFWLKIENHIHIVQPNAL